MGFFKNAIAIKGDFVIATIATLYMTFVTAIIAGVIGIILGIILTVTEEDGILENRFVNYALDKIINLLRSIPFIILLALIAPLTRLIVGTRIGETAAIVPLVFGTFPFFARQVQNVLLETDRGIVEAAEAMGDSEFEIITRVYLRESLPGLIRVSALTIISLIGLTTMAGAIGAGGLGKLAIAQGYNRFQDDITVVATLIILVIVYIIQGLSNILIKKISH